MIDPPGDVTTGAAAHRMHYGDGLPRARHDPMAQLDRITVWAAHRILSGAPLPDLLTLEAVDRIPVEPPDGSVLKFVRTLGPAEKRYTYTALRAGHYWYTSAVNVSKMTWPNLVDLIGDNPCWIATDWAEIPTPEPSPFAHMTPAEWHAAMFPANTIETKVDSTTES